MRSVGAVLLLVLIPTVRADDGHMKPVYAVKSVTASSTLAEKNRSYAAWQLVAPRYAQDENGAEIIDSAWCEARKEEGLGETVTITLARPMKIASIAVKAGVWKTDKLFAANNRIVKLDVTTDDGRAFLLEPPDTKEEGEVAVGGKPVATITLKVAKVKKGKYNDSCLSEVRLVLDPDARPIVGVEAGAADVLEASLKTLSKALDECDEQGMRFQIAFPLKFKSNAWMAMGGEKVEHTFKTAAELAKACQAEHKTATNEDEGETPRSSKVPGGIPIDLSGIGLTAEGDGAITVSTQRNDLPQLWRMKFVDGRWKLLLVDY